MKWEKIRYLIYVHIDYVYMCVCVAMQSLIYLMLAKVLYQCLSFQAIRKLTNSKTIHYLQYLTCTCTCTCSPTDVRVIHEHVQYHISMGVNLSHWYGSQPTTLAQVSTHHIGMGLNLSYWHGCQPITLVWVSTYHIGIGLNPSYWHGSQPIILAWVSTYHHIGMGLNLPPHWHRSQPIILAWVSTYHIGMGLNLSHWYGPQPIILAWVSTYHIGMGLNLFINVVTCVSYLHVRSY